MVTSKTLPGQTKVKSTSSSDSSSEVLVEPNPNLRCVAEETDTRLWLHVKKPNCSNILIMSPDTDIYNIGLPLLSVCDKNIMVQLNPYYSKELKYLHFTAFLQVLQNDPDLSSIPAEKIPQIFQSLFVSTWCDYSGGGTGPADPASAGPIFFISA